MTKTRKPFAELTAAGKARRLAGYQKERDKYGLYQGLFNCTAISDNGTVKAKNGKVYHKFGFNVTPISTDADWDNGVFSWVNNLVEVGRGDSAIQAFQDMKKDLDDMKRAKTGKAIQLQIDFKPDSIGGISANKVYRTQFRNKKKAAPKAQTGLTLQPRNSAPATKAQPQLQESDLPF